MGHRHTQTDGQTFGVWDINPGDICGKSLLRKKEKKKVKMIILNHLKPTFYGSIDVNIYNFQFKLLGPYCMRITTKVNR